MKAERCVSILKLVFTLFCASVLSVEVVITEAVEHENTTLICYFPGLNPFDVTWYKNNTGNMLMFQDENDNRQCGGNVVNGSSWDGRACGYWNGSSHVVTLRNVSLSDQFLYICQVNEPGNPAVSANNTLFVVVPPSSTELTITQSTDVFTLTCLVSRVKPLEYMMFRWFINDVEQSAYTNTSSTNSDGTVKATSTLNYPACVAVKTIARCQVDWKNNTYQSVEKELPFAAPPSNTTISSNTTNSVLVYDGVRLHCNVTVPGNPSSYTYTWARLSGRQTTCTQENCTFYITDVSYDDTYSCVARNTYCIGNNATYKLTVNAPPDLLSLPAIIEVNYDEEMTSTCIVTAKPRADVTWNIPDDQTDVLESVVGSDSSTDGLITSSAHLVWYTGSPEARKTANGTVLSCTANNSFGTDNSGFTTLLVIYPPNATRISAINTTVVIGDVVSLSCDVTETGNPPVYTFYWSTTSTQSLNCSTSSTCTFQVSTIFYEGTYSCVATNKYGSGETASLNLTVNAAPTFYTHPPGTLEVINDEELNSTCAVKAKPEADVKWNIPVEPVDVLQSVVGSDSSKDGQTVSTTYLIWNSGSSIENRKTANGTVLNCTASNIVSAVQTDTELVVYYGPGESFLSVDQTLIDVEDTANFTCSYVDGYPEATQFIFNSSSSIVANVSISSHLMKITGINQEEWYSCYGQNFPLEQTRSGTSTNSLKLTVLVPPLAVNITAKPLQEPVFNDTSFTMNCQGTGKPQVDVSWLKDNQTVNLLDFHINNTIVNGAYMYDLTQAVSSDLQWDVRKIQMTCSGVTYYDGIYQCGLSNIGPDSNTRTNTTPEVAVRTKYYPLWADNAPSLFYAELNQTNITLTCEVCAHPTNITYRWTFNGTAIAGCKERWCTIYNVTMDDFGNYTCIAFNEVDVKEFLLEFLESGPPRLESNLIILENTTSVALTLQWKLDGDGGHRIIGYSVYYRNQSDPYSNFTLYKENITSNDSIVTETVIGLHATTEYEFKVVVRNNNTINPNENTDEVTNIGATSASPNVTLNTVKITATQMEVTWTYEHPSNDDQNETLYETLPQVGVRIAYGTSNKCNSNSLFDECKLHPNDTTEPIDATAHQESITDNFTEYTTYMVFLLTYENGIPSISASEESNSQAREISSPGRDNSSLGAILGSVFGVLLIVVVIIIGLFMYKERLHNPFSKKEHPDSEVPMDPLEPFGPSDGPPFNPAPIIAPKPPIDQPHKPIPIERRDYINVTLQRRFSVEAFCTFVFKNRRQEKIYQSEFKDIKLEADGKDITYCSDEALRPKNRYKNILPYDDTRVKLSEQPGQPYSDYINASFIPNFNKNERAYIASHGPTTQTVEDFWRMIWEYKVHVIVMVTTTMENGTMKCIDYWPTKDSVKHGDIIIKNAQSKQLPELTIASLELRKGDALHTVEHISFHSWSDHSVPDTTAFIKLMRTVKHISSRHTTPAVVHCSAGVGRTGTFIAINNLCDEAKATGSVDVRAAVEHLRSYRMKMIQTPDQYQFLYETLAELLSTGNTSMTVQGFAKSLALCKQEGQLNKQFKTLRLVLPDYPEECFQTAKSNKDKNRTNVLPAEKNLVFLQNIPNVKNNYINAVFLPGYHHSTDFCCTQIPLVNTVVDFWRLASDFNSACIVCLETIADEPQWYPSERSLRLGFTDVHKVSETGTPSARVIKVKLGEQDAPDAVYANTQDGKYVTIFVTKKQTSSKVSAKMLMDLYGSVASHQRPDSPTIVMCRDGATQCGVFVACCSILNMAEREKEVDIYGTVRKIQNIRPECIATQEQYELLYDTMKMHTDNFSEYANV